VREAGRTNYGTDVAIRYPGSEDASAHAGRPQRGPPNTTTGSTAYWSVRLTLRSAPEPLPTRRLGWGVRRHRRGLLHPRRPRHRSCQHPKGDL